MKKGKIVAMLLAGGQGTRLKELTKNLAKPAVPFGGKYRIIDFALSNAANSGIEDIGVLTQYKPFILNSHIGIGSAWDYDRNVGGLRILQPFMSEKGGRWYKGTANAIYENMNFIDELDPEYVLILSGDHIYKMNYIDLLEAHQQKDADVTLAVLTVPWEDTSRFGIINVDEDNKIVEFEEKPKKAKSNLASMGIYMFNWPTLREYLVKDNEDKNSDNDFGKNVLPLMLRDNKKMYTWEFKGYWKDVGTVKSYWEANMDLLNPDNTLNLYDRDWRIYTRTRNLPPQYIHKSAKVVNSMINEGCYIEGTVEKSVLFGDVIVEKGAVVKNSVVLSNSVIKRDAKVYNAVVMEGVIVESGKEIGMENGNKIYMVTNDKVVAE